MHFIPEKGEVGNEGAEHAEEPGHCGGCADRLAAVEWDIDIPDTDFPAYSDTGYSDTPLTVTV